MKINFKKIQVALFLFMLLTFPVYSACHLGRRGPTGPTGSSGETGATGPTGDPFFNAFCPVNVAYGIIDMDGPTTGSGFGFTYTILSPTSVVITFTVLANFTLLATAEHTVGPGTNVAISIENRTINSAELVLSSSADAINVLAVSCDLL